MAKATTVKSVNLKKNELRLVEKDGIFYGLVNGKLLVQGTGEDVVWMQLHDQAGKANPKYFGFDGARNRFLTFFPGGFGSESYKDGERNYKMNAKVKLDTTLPLEKALVSSDLGEAALAAFQATNLLSLFEKARLKNVLRGARADAFVRAAARFASGEGETALEEMKDQLTPNDCAKWTVVTYLPFLWKPDEHMFLKPTVTKDFAYRVGHKFASDYSAQLNIEVYESLLDLASKTNAEVLDLKPQDRIDIQSFIWTVGEYEEEVA